MIKINGMVMVAADERHAYTPSNQVISLLLAPLTSLENVRSQGQSHDDYSDNVFSQIELLA